MTACIRINSLRTCHALRSRALTRSDPDRIDASTLQWSVDDDFASMEPYAGAPDAVLLTTKKPGTTWVRVSGSAADGQTFEDERNLGYLKPPTSNGEKATCDITVVRRSIG